MTELLKTLRGAVALDISTLVQFRDGRDVFRRGVTVLVLVALMVGAVAFILDFVGGLIAPSFDQEIGDITAAFDTWFQFMPEESPGFREEVTEALSGALEIARSVDALPTRLPRPLTTFFGALASWVGRPLTMLGGFLAYGIWVMLAAKLLGGRGRLQEFLGTAALSSGPYLLLVLERVPCLGSLLKLVAWVWATVIWVAATAVTHGWAVPQTNEEGETVDYEVEWGRAILAVILPALVVAFLALFALVGLGGIIAAIASSAQS
jgi:hypothetical protein